MHFFSHEGAPENKANRVSIFMERRICRCRLAGPGFTQTLGTDRVLLCERRRPQCAGVAPPVPAPCVLLDGKVGQAEPRGSAILRIFSEL